MIARQLVGPAAFVDFWEPLYDYKKEYLYDDNIGQPLTPRSVRELFLWKSGGWFNAQQETTIEQAFVDRISDLQRLDKSTNAPEFLAEFSSGGPIWRIFWLHVWEPERFPIYDQHVHRAMCWLQEGRGSEIPSTESGKVTEYLERFVPFFKTFAGVDRRRADKALWVCGKRLKPFGSKHLSTCNEAE